MVQRAHKWPQIGRENRYRRGGGRVPHLLLIIHVVPGLARLPAHPAGPRALGFRQIVRVGHTPVVPPLLGQLAGEEVAEQVLVAHRVRAEAKYKVEFGTVGLAGETGAWDVEGRGGWPEAG
eukprot:scaffold12230_cov62-Isochrysis_galbana.AAC.1